MNINLHIERVILDGLPIARHQAPQIQAAIEAELSRLLASGGLDAGFLATGAVPHLSVGDMQLQSGSDSAQLGAQIASALYGGLCGEKT
jgi:uncharacterized membrane protein